MTDDSSLDPERLFILPEGSSESTFQDDDSLPSLPVPTLEESLSLYVQSLRPLLSEDELATSQKIVKDFASSDVAQMLQRKLEEKGRKCRNWMERWWDEEVYLKFRLPITPFNNMIGIAGTPETVRDLDPYCLMNLSCYLEHCLRFWKLIREERVRPQKVKRGKDMLPLTMHQFRRCFNCCQIPGKGMDSIKFHFKTKAEGPCPNHVVVFHRGHIFVLNPVSRNEEIWTAHQWYKALKKVIDDTENQGQGIGILTCDFRENWASNRQKLWKRSAQNRQILKLIETSILAVILDPDEPKNSGEAIAFASGTQSPDRWVDKSFSMIVYKNAYQGSMSVHTPFEATVSVTFSAYIAVATAVTPPNSFPRDPTVNIGEIKELLFDLPDGILDECQRVMEASKAMLSTLSMDSFVFDAFGRDDIKKVTQIHTDSIVQIAMHLAYYRLYKKAPSTYESATVRRFYRGRTETCRSSSAEILTFAQAMVDPQESDARRYTLLCDAAHAHRRYMQRCEAGMGCDRHLLGLKMIAKEMGIDPDELPIFKDPSWKQSGGDGNYILSTSFMGYVTFVGGLVPMREDGYSFFYTMDRNAMYYSMACYATCPDTCIYRFQKEIARALTDVVELLTTRIAKL